MIKLKKQNNKYLTLRAIFDTDKAPEGFIKEKNNITIYLSKKEAYIYLGKTKEYSIKTLKSAAAAIVAKNKRGFNVDMSTFVKNELDLNQVVKFFTEKVLFLTDKVYSLKTNKKKDDDLDIILINADKAKESFSEAKMYGEIITWVRSRQVMPPNELNSVNFAEEIKKEFSKIKNVDCKILTKPEIKKLGMGLFLSVNRGSSHDARLVVLEYKGDPKSKEKSALVGKGIMYDSGGYSIKTGKHMNGMKFDMTGAAVVIGAMKAIAQLKPKANFVAIAPLTDNRLNGDASMPDMIFKSMNGKTVEVNNTDAEGRLVLADAVTYAIRETKATNITTIATLTGAVLSALGHTYTGTWATEDKYWERISNAAKLEDELVWRMPFHTDFIKYMKKCKVADLKNTDFTGMGGSISAAMFLKEFAEDKTFIHLDIAGTADVNETPMAPLVKTLSKLER